MTSEEYAKLVGDITAAAINQDLDEFERLSELMVEYVAEEGAKLTKLASN